MSDKFTFIYEHTTYEGLKKIVTHTTEELTLSDVLDDIAEFLKGCGYQVNGRLEIVDE